MQRLEHISAKSQLAKLNIANNNEDDNVCSKNDLLVTLITTTEPTGAIIS